jgi:uncharacterized cupin superfamily protein
MFLLLTTQQQCRFFVNRAAGKAEPLVWLRLQAVSFFTEVAKCSYTTGSENGTFSEKRLHTAESMASEADKEASRRRSGLINLSTAPVRTGSIYPPPYDAFVKGRTSIRVGDAGNLTQFGVNLIVLQPGAYSSLRHWHQNEDEFVYVTEGQVTLIEDDKRTEMSVGDCAAFPASCPVGHHFFNHSTAKIAKFLVVGTRATHEVATYSDVDLRVEISQGMPPVFTHKDGTPLGSRSQGGGDSGMTPAISSESSADAKSTSA